jgi:hypothetical protein
LIAATAFLRGKWSFGPPKVTPRLGRIASAGLACTPIAPVGHLGTPLTRLRSFPLGVGSGRSKGHSGSPQSPANGIGRNGPSGWVGAGASKAHKRPKVRCRGLAALDPPAFSVELLRWHRPGNLRDFRAPQRGPQKADPRPTGSAARRSQRTPRQLRCSQGQLRRHQNPTRRDRPSRVSRAAPALPPTA